MKRKIKNINAWNIIWLLIYLMPFLLSLGYTFVMANSLQQNGTISTINYLDYYVDYLTSIVRFFSGGSGGTSGFIYNGYYSLVRYFFANLGTDNLVFYYLIPLVLQYITFISIIRIAVDVLLMLPNIIHNFIDKLGGERE